MTSATDTSIDDLREKELEYIVERRRKASAPGVVPNRDEVASSLLGLALSGGGIRSATTNLGILQALSRMGILPVVDYISTVSGGGYIGACFSSLLSIRDKAEPGSADQFTYASRADLKFTSSWADFPFNPEMQPTGAARCAPQAQQPVGKKVIAHLRTHGNFLIARRGLFKRDALRSVGHLLTGTVYHVVCTVLGVFLIALMLMGAAHLLDRGLDARLTPGPALPAAAATPAVVCCGAVESQPDWRQQYAHRFNTAGADIWRMLKARRYEAPLAWGAATAVLVLGLFISAMRVRNHAVRRKDQSRVARGLRWLHRATPGESAEDWFERRVLVGSVLVLVTALLGFLFTHIDPDRGAPMEARQVGWVLQPALLLAGARLATLLLYPLIALCDGELLPLTLWSRGMRSLWGSFQAITTYGTILLLLFACLPVTAYAAAHVSLWAMLAPLISLVAGRLLLAVPTAGAHRRFRVPRGLVHFLLAIALTVFIGFITIESAAIAVQFGFDTPWSSGYGWWLLCLGLPLLFLSGLGNINRISPHYFYRDRIIETYLRTEIADKDGRMQPLRDTMEMSLTDLHGNRQGPAGASANTAPYLLISAAINLAGSRDLTRRDRKSGYFLFSKYFCGSRQTGYLPTKDYRGGDTKLARAITISGAAAGSGMGFHTFFAQSAMMTLLNLRLGYWMSNPRRNMPDGIAFWPWYIFREVFGATHERTWLVNLSDGGHTGDNVGIYPLFERRCQVIIACDAEADPHLSFGSFTEVLRHAYIDLGIDVDIDLAMLRPDPETGRSKSHCAIGRIRYPECPHRPNWIVYMKSSLTGDEPAPVMNYKTTCPDFPHESTADQFFDDAQFESYRALGVHIAEDTFAIWTGDPEVARVLAERSPL